MDLINTSCTADPPRQTKLYHCATLVGEWEEERRQFTVGLGDQKTSPDAHFFERTTYDDSYLYPTTEQVVNAKPLSCFTVEAPRELMFYHGDTVHPVKSQIPLSELSWSDRKKEPYTYPETLEIMGVSRRHNLCNTAERSRGLLDNCSPDYASHPAVRKEEAYLRSLQRIYVDANPSLPVKEGSNPPGDQKTKERERRDTYPDAVSQSTCECPLSSGNCYAVPYQKPPKEYVPPYLPPIGRVAERNRFLTHKNITIDATGLHLWKNLSEYPATSSDLFGEFTMGSNNVMYRTKLRPVCNEEDCPAP